MYNAGIYLRLSQEDERAGQSESISNQRDFVTGYVSERGWNIAGVYIDDGYSGLNFNRPGFLRLLSDIESGRVNLVITKDLSRLGRDYIDTGFYLERYFPGNNIRYIAINDGIDTNNADNGDDMSPFRAVINDMYARDISKKVRTALRTKKMKGDFIGSSAPYGYQKDPDNKGRLIIKEETADIVRRIFAMFIADDTKRGIAGKLTSLGIVPPSQDKTKKWNEVTVSRILTNPTYKGDLTQNRAKKVNYKLDKKVNLPRNDWIIVEGTHQPIISKEDFDTVQQIIEKRSYAGKTVHLLSGLVKCGDCGASMTFARGNMICSAWKRNGFCSAHTIREDYVENQVISKLQASSRQAIVTLVNKIEIFKDGEIKIDFKQMMCFTS